uniref:MARVEL domain-containing protein n=1 Tax=Sphenodon punctatus TaxID=8508 RepID=A0A8D0GTT0_SPHPU
WEYSLNTIAHYFTNKRSTQGAPYPERSRPSTASLDPYRKNPVPAYEYDNSTPQFYPHKETFSEKCSNLCSRRGILQFVEITVSILVLICVGASQAALSGYSSMGGLGSFSIDSAYSPFEGSELQEVRDLDMQYSQMRAPCVYGGVAFSLALTALTLLFLIAGGKPLHRLSVRLLVVECIFDILACMGYIAAVGLYLHFVIQVNSTDICKRRERVYARRGYTWMSCEVQGGDAAVALFGIIAACLYLPSAVICTLTIQTVRDIKSHLPRTHYMPESHSREEEQPKVSRRPESNHGAQTLATLV